MVKMKNKFKYYQYLFRNVNEGVLYSISHVLNRNQDVKRGLRTHKDDSSPQEGTRIVPSEMELV